ncbi:hypothetical protein LPW11_04190 [Geomonas sp. RF6]|uniref:GSU3473 family protein n=1 Tax=Geomonas sp. RF6 TaxID=2897342 RepID=UPI001E31873E|nr:hypothetical protein [Geomonas sp. RF6]UFS71399.1 hypothetical protein LPW11_04190 [Geomonas sp. RF6]
MLIRVVYCDGETGLVRASEIEKLIKTDEISAFCRSDGWVRIGTDPIREGQEPYEGLGRRWSDIASESTKAGPRYS